MSKDNVGPHASGGPGHKKKIRKLVTLMVVGAIGLVGSVVGLIVGGSMLIIKSKREQAEAERLAVGENPPPITEKNGV